MDWINEDGTFKPGFETNLPEEVREYAKGVKDIVGAFKRGADTQREFHTRVKLPTDPEARRTFVKEHFKDVLDADAKAAQEQQAKAAEAAKAKEQDDAQKQLDASRQRVKDMLGTEADTKIELCRRAFRGKFCPQWIKDGIALAAGVEFDKLTDEKFKEIIAADPAVVQTLLTIGELTKDGRMATGDGRHGDKVEEQKPPQPSCPELHKNEPANSPYRRWFENRGYSYEKGEWETRRPQ